MKSIKQLLAILGIAGAVSAATAQTTNIILQTDFDGDANQGNYNTYYGYTAAGYGIGASSGSCVAGNSFTLSGGTGVGGTTNLTSVADYSLLPFDPNWTNAADSYVYAVLGAGTSFGSPVTPITPTSLMSSFILSADLQVLGLPPQLTNADVSITKVQCFSNTTVLLFDFNGDAGNVGSNYTHIAVPLSSLSYGAGPGDPAPLYPDASAFTNAAIVGSINYFTIEYAVKGLLGTIGGTGANQIRPVFGFTNNAVLNVDNIELVQTGNTVPTPTVERLIWQSDFDTTFPDDAVYGFSYRDGNNTATGTLSTNLTGGIGGSASLEYTVDLSSWSGSPPALYSGIGVGATESPIPFTLTLTNNTSYRVYLSAKVGGVSAGVTNVSGVVDLLFRAPSNATEIVVFDLNPTITFTTNWQSYVFNNMPIGVNNGGSQALFDQYVSQVNQLSVQVVPQGSPNVATLFGYDANNTVDIDNIKVVELEPGLAPLTVAKTNNQVQVIWTDPATGGWAKLQSATNVAGPYVDVSGASSAAASPYTVPSGSGQQFFRTMWVP